MLLKKIKLGAYFDGYSDGKDICEAERDIAEMRNDILEKENKELNQKYDDLKLLYEDALDDLDYFYDYSH